MYIIVKTVVLYSSEPHLLTWAAELVAREKHVRAVTPVQNAGADIYFLGLRLHASKSDVARIVTKTFKNAVRVKR